MNPGWITIVRPWTKRLAASWSARPYGALRRLLVSPPWKAATPDYRPGNASGKLSTYGRCLAVYRGAGALILTDGFTAKCNFEAGQLADGTVLLHCDFVSPHPLLSAPPPASFEGTTETGSAISINNDLREVNYLPEPPAGRDSFVLAVFRARDMAVTVTQGAPASSVHFGLTNFLFAGTTLHQDPDGSGYFVLPLQLDALHSRLQVTIAPIHHYSDIAHRLITVKDVDVTCEARVTIGPSDDIESLASAMDDLSYVLSIARGTKVQWIYRDSYSAEGTLVSRLHAARITKPYAPLSPIDTRHEGAAETKAFIEGAFPHYCQKRESLRLSRGTISAYLDAKAENDYLELRGVKLAVSIETLKNVFVKAPGSPAQETILDDTVFKGLKKPLHDALKQVLVQNKVLPRNRDSMYKKLGELNRYAFDTIMRALCQDIALAVTDDEIALFIACRNSLIHQGRFYCESATEDERAELAPLPSKVAEYLFLVNFVDRFFLKLFGYTGTYIDWRTPNDPTRVYLP